MPILPLRRLCVGLLLLVLAGCGLAPPHKAGDLKIASWNLEHLAEADGSGCRPRTEADYAALRRYADQLDADVVAFQEVESAQAARRVFPPDRYDIVFSRRPDSGRHGYCRRGGEEGGLTIRQQSVGFAIRKGLPYARHPDLSALALGNPDLRWGVDVTVRGAQPVRLLALHLKSGCSSGAKAEACPTLFDQMPVVGQWMAARRDEGVAFAVLGDWNRRLALAGDPLWPQLAQAAGVPLTDAAGGRGATCKQRFRDFIDHIVLGPAAAGRLAPDSFEEFTYGVAEAEHPSDHCPIAVRLR
ncbi:endonuclease/exonuclease/phosphatase family protein [Dokdonella koreensis]|uniref:Endonuclease/exonuclease/phosphatase n=1 Tax=Dokdonella koreensis DS-123 TaxID=1300342 RepID=A0A167H3F6_9GAMM|nr:endonuclease/exonuclease/phosphatase family protein [Dokdonella koreensis]ANB18726.1 Endonuclease/exonuclease/phosphatase [Dokdonella koreensis DS-123]